ncbi:hypothetical protein DAI22_01g456700 [Oryza sativa Japonica Group]|nr:hypothetical protein DAI22_01g456700 [Oryza sativa Japonica Group]
MLQLTSLHCGFAVLFLLGYLELQVALLINLFILPYGQRVASDGNATCLASALGCLPHRSRDRPVAWRVGHPASGGASAGGDWWLRLRR